jgi:acylglycerol lipase
MYGILFPTLASSGIQVHAFDQRGWGRSVHKPSDKGLTGPTTQVLADITAFIKPLLPSTVPLFLMGHSMGGAEVLCYAAEGPLDTRKHIRGYILESPFIAFHPSSKPSAVTVVLGRLAGKLLPKRQLYNELKAELLTRSVEIQKKYQEDPLCHNTGTLEGLAGMLDRASGLESGKIRVAKDAGEGGKTRILLSHGTADGVCEYRATVKVFEQLDAVDDKELKLYEGWYHQCELLFNGLIEDYANKK